MENNVRPPLRLSRRTTKTAARAPLIVFTALAMLASSACGPAASSPAAGSGGLPTAAADAIKVVATTTVFADIVQNVGRSRVVPTSIIPAGVGPEDYEPKPDDARKLSDAKLLVSNGLGLAKFLDRL